MIVGVLTVELFIGESSSLKDKRRHIKGLTTRLRNRYNISVAEVDNQDSWQRGTLGIAAVSNRSAHIDQTLAEVLNFINIQNGLEIISCETEHL